MLPRPPTATLFPYTTLFRSRRRETRTCGVFVHDAADRSYGGDEGRLLLPGFVRREQRLRARRDHRRVVEARGLDRKSTRLNSSHSSISYAVFCLNKKRTCRS